MTPHIAIVTGAHLCRNPRVVKEAEALADAGFRVTVLRPVFSQPLADLDRDLSAGAAWSVQTTVSLVAGRAESVWTKGLRRVATGLTRRGIETPSALGYGVRETLRLARDLGADLTIGHQEVGLWVANRLAEEGRLVGVDIEDWYSEDLPPEARQSRPTRLLRHEEATAVRRGGHVTTTSDALGHALQRAFGGPAPTTVYNAFPWADRRALDGEGRDRPAEDGRLSLHWVSQTVGPGRGLERVIRALADVEAPVDLHLRGHSSPEMEAALRRHLPPGSPHRLVIHGPVPPSELLSRIAEHDVGLALEPGSSLNNDLTASNKILHYLLAGLPVIATATAGQQEVARKAPHAIRTFPIGDTGALARRISEWASDRAGLQAASAAALDAARREFNWEVQQERLVGSVQSALGEPRPSSTADIGQPS